MKLPSRLIFAVLIIGIALGALWIALAPLPERHHREAQQVPVTEAPEMSAPTGDEQSEVIGTAMPTPAPESASPEAAAPEPAKGSANIAPKIAIVIDDMGLDLSGSRRAVALPAAITLSYIPYATRLHEQTRDARDAGHELLLHMPMEPVGSADPGEGALLVNLPPDELRQRLDTALASFVGFDGMNNHMGSKFTANRDDMQLVMDEIKGRHIFFLDSRTSAQSVGYKVAKENGLPAISRDVFLDDDMSPKAVRLQLEQVERVASRKGYAVAIGHPHAVTLEALEEWLPEAEKRGFVFVPINSLVNNAP